MKHAVCKVEDIKINEKKVVSVKGRSIVLIRTEGDRFHAVRNACSHQGVPLVRGNLLEAALPSEVGEYCFSKDKKVLRCPWHNYEFDIETGKSPISGDRHRVRVYDVTVENGQVFIEL